MFFFSSVVDGVLVARLTSLALQETSVGFSGQEFHEYFTREAVCSQNRVP